MDRLASFCVDAFVVAGVVWPYIPQARSVLRTRSVEGFSPSVSLVILVSATLRVAFWFGRRFETALLLQALASIATQMAMMAVLVHTRNATKGKPVASALTPGSAARVRIKTIWNLDWREFWAWDDFTSYVLFELLFASMLACLCLGLGMHTTWLVEALGTASLGIEAVLPVPQAWQNFQKKSTTGLSSVLIISWVAGDAFKSIYAVVKRAPVQFLACGVFQLVVDLIILAQMHVLYTPAKTISTVGSRGSGTSNNSSSTSDVRSDPALAWASHVRERAEQELDAAKGASHAHSHKHSSHAHPHKLAAE